MKGLGCVLYIFFLKTGVFGDNFLKEKGGFGI
jgi:hypothetical protein